MTSLSAHLTPEADTSQPRLLVDESYVTPTRDGTLLVGKLERGELTSGQELVSQLSDGQQLRVVIRTVDSVTVVNGARRVGLLLEPVASELLLPGMVFTAPQKELRHALPLETVDRETLERYVALIADRRLRLFVTVGAVLLATMTVFAVGLASFYVVTDQQARTPILISLVVTLVTPIYFFVSVLSRHYFAGKRADFSVRRGRRGESSGTEKAGTRPTR
jgi:hypothetical protein